MAKTKSINIDWRDFGHFLKGTNTRAITKKQYIYQFKKFNYDAFNYSNLISFLEKNNNEVARAMLTKLKEYILTNYKKLGLNRDQKNNISEVKIPYLNKKISRLPKSISHKKVMRGLEFINTKKERLMYLISYYGSLRVGELMKLRVRSINLDEFNEEKILNNRLIQGEMKTLGKSDREGISIIPPYLMNELVEYINYKKLNYDDFLFREISLKYGSNIKRWERTLEKVGIDSGISVLNEKGKPTKETKLTPHVLRHSFALHLLLDEKKDIRIIQEALRHKSITSTEIYTRFDKSELKKELIGVS